MIKSQKTFSLNYKYISQLVPNTPQSLWSRQLRNHIKPNLMLVKCCNMPAIISRNNFFSFIEGISNA